MVPDGVKKTGRYQTKYLPFSQLCFPFKIINSLIYGKPAEIEYPH